MCSFKVTKIHFTKILIVFRKLNIRKNSSTDFPIFLMCFFKTTYQKTVNFTGKWKVQKSSFAVNFV